MDPLPANCTRKGSPSEGSFAVDGPRRAFSDRRREGSSSHPADQGAAAAGDSQPHPVDFDRIHTGEPLAMNGDAARMTIPTPQAAFSVGRVTVGRRALERAGGVNDAVWQCREEWRLLPE